VGELIHESVTLDLDKPRVFRLDLAAMSDLQKLTGLKMSEIGKWISDSNEDVLRVATIVWAGCRAQDPELTIESASHLIGFMQLPVVLYKIMLHLGYAMQSIPPGEGKNAEGATETKSPPSGTGTSPWIQRPE
jgi:hypothetical protein